MQRVANLYLPWQAYYYALCTFGGITDHTYILDLHPLSGGALIAAVTLSMSLVFFFFKLIFI